VPADALDAIGDHVIALGALDGIACGGRTVGRRVCPDGGSGSDGNPSCDRDCGPCGGCLGGNSSGGGGCRPCCGCLGGHPSGGGGCSL
jgi:hypothetical protein